MSETPQDDEISELERQLSEVQDALLEDPHNAELMAAATELKEVIALAKSVSGGGDGGAAEPAGSAAPAATGAEEQPPQKKKKQVRTPGVINEPQGDVPQEIPAWLKIKPTDTEKVKQSKKKRIHAIKSQMRLKKLDDESKQRASSWQSFQHKKGAAAAKHESIFRSPDTIQGRVGVTGSGRGLTPDAGVRERFRMTMQPPPSDQH